MAENSLDPRTWDQASPSSLWRPQWVKEHDFNECESSSFAPFLFAHFYLPLTLKEPNFRNVISKQLKLPRDLRSPECTPRLV